jgi:ABC-type glycerol-3-phosphate transport system substrate-binding protein
MQLTAKWKAKKLTLLGRTILSGAFLACVGSSWVQAGESKPTWETEWRETVEAAKKEAQVTVYHTRGPFDKVFEDFNRSFPGIKVVSVPGRGGDLITRMMAERRAGKYLADMYLGSSGTPLDVLYPAKALEPLQSFLICRK